MKTFPEALESLLAEMREYESDEAPQIRYADLYFEIEQNQTVRDLAVLAVAAIKSDLPVPAWSHATVESRIAQSLISMFRGGVHVGMEMEKRP